MFKKLCAKILQVGMQQEKKELGHPVPDVRGLERMFGDCTPAIVAFKIDNGYVVRSIVTSAYEGSTGSGFTYCKDHAAIADHIVAESAREKLVQPHYGTKDVPQAKGIAARNNLYRS